MYARANWNISPARVSSLILKAISVKQKPLYENLPLNTDIAQSPLVCLLRSAKVNLEFLLFVHA